jgi:SAM-dependent methyltransferase
MALKLNIGCGFNKRPGYINVDKEKACEPDVVADLEGRWPFEDNTVDEVSAIHVLEHLGQSTQSFLGIMKEIYRVCRNGAKVHIVVPHHNHWTFHADPTHVRKILPEGLRLFDQEFNRECIQNGDASTPLGIYCGVDFALSSSVPSYDEPWGTRLRDGLCLQEDLEFASRHYVNAIAQWEITLTVRKAAKVI